MLVAAAAFAQEPIRVSTRLIETTAVVRDSHGPVHDLPAEAFQILDDGKPQKIAVFRVSQSNVKTEAATRLPADVFSNRVARSAAPDNRTLLLLDTRNTDMADQIYARKQTIAMLETNEFHHPVGIYVFGDRARLLHDFTMDKQALIDSLTKLLPEQSQKLRMASVSTLRIDGGGPTAALEARSFAEMRAYGNRDRAWNTVDAFADLERFLARVPGRKSIIWITNAFPAGFLRGEDHRMQRLALGDVAIYSVYARGVASIRSPEVDTLNWVADQTGGRAYYNSNDLGNEMHAAIEDTETFYTLGFYAQRDKPDGKFHRLKITLDRPGVDIRHRAGYFDSEPKVAKVEPSALLKLAAATSSDASDIGLVAAIQREGANYRVAVQINFRDLILEENGGTWTGAAELAFLTQSTDGQTLNVASKNLTFNMSDEAYQARQRDGFSIEQTVPASNKAARIRVVIVDRSGIAGSVSITPLP